MKSELGSFSTSEKFYQELSNVIWKTNGLDSATLVFTSLYWKSDFAYVEIVFYSALTRDFLLHELWCLKSLKSFKKIAGFCSSA